jgi:hypothetical protein
MDILAHTFWNKCEVITRDSLGLVPKKITKEKHPSYRKRHDYNRFSSVKEFYEKTPMQSSFDKLQVINS